MKRATALLLSLIYLVLLLPNTYALSPATISEFNPPDELPLGKPYIIRGTINSSSIISEVRFQIIQPDGRMELERIAHPNARSYNLNKMDYVIEIDILTEGEKRFLIIVTDELGTYGVFDKNIVIASGIGPSVEGLYIPDRLPHGKPYVINGTVTSGSLMSKVHVSIMNLDTGKEEDVISANPNSLTYDLKQIDEKIRIDWLSVGRKRFNIYVTTKAGQICAYTKDFEIYQEATPPAAESVNPPANEPPSQEPNPPIDDGLQADTESPLPQPESAEQPAIEAQHAHLFTYTDYDRVHPHLRIGTCNCGEQVSELSDKIFDNCNECGKIDSSIIINNEISLKDTTFQTIKDDVPVRDDYHKTGKIVKTIKESLTPVTIISIFINDAENLWGKTDDGYYVHMPNLEYRDSFDKEASKCNSTSFVKGSEDTCIITYECIDINTHIVVKTYRKICTECGKDYFGYHAGNGSATYQEKKSETHNITEGRHCYYCEYILGESTPRDNQLDTVQLGLTGLGAIPGVGEVFDIIDGSISLARGDYSGAILSFASALPLVGNLATASKTVDKADNVIDVTKNIDRAIDTSKAVNITDKVFVDGKKVFLDFDINNAYVKARHLNYNTESGNYSKFLANSKEEAERLLRQVIKEGNILSIDYDEISKFGNEKYLIILDAREVIGTKGETKISIVISSDGGMLSAFPTK